MATKADVINVLNNVHDPELGISVVDLGLVYQVDIADDMVRVTMTLTVPGCPLHNVIAGSARQALRNLPGVKNAVVEMVWDPPWHPMMMSERARRQLGWG